MKRNIRSIFLALGVSALALAAAADEPATAFQVRIDVLMVSMPEEKFLVLQPDLLDQSKIEKAIPDILDAIKRKEMTLEGCPMVVAKSGQHAVIATEEDTGYTAPPRDPFAIFQRAPSFVPLPTVNTSNETRNTGVMLEVEPVLSGDARKIQLTLVPRHVELVGYDHFTLPKEKAEAAPDGDDDAAINGPEQPVYFDAKASTSLTLRSGQHMLLGVFKKEKPGGTVEIFILGAEVIRAGK